MTILTKQLSDFWSWRRIAKLSALFLPFGFIKISEPVFFTFVLILFVVAVGFDVVRFLRPTFNQRYLANRKFAKFKESRRLSGYVFFLFSTLTLFQFFSYEIIAIALSFFIVADLTAPVIGQRFLTRRIVGDKTWGGALGIIIACLITGFLITILYPLALDPKLIVLAAVTVAILDQLSFFLDDNLLVPLGTAVILSTIL